MIINVRGTHGSGKSTLVRMVLDSFHSKPVYIDGRKSPIGYRCRRFMFGKYDIFIAGSYENPTGGCDTIGKVDVMYRMIRKYAKRGYDVLFEGILAQHSTPNIHRLSKDWDVRVVVIDIDVERAVKSVLKRRRARGDRRPFDPTNVHKEAASTIRAAERLRADLTVYYPKTRRAALARVTALLENPDEKES